MTNPYTYNLGRDPNILDKEDTRDSTPKEPKQAREDERPIKNQNPKEEHVKNEDPNEEPMKDEDPGEEPVDDEDPEK